MVHLVSIIIIIIIPPPGVRGVLFFSSLNPQIPQSLKKGELLQGKRFFGDIP